MIASTSLWSGEKQPIFNAWEAMTPEDDFFAREERYEQWARDLFARDEAQRHFMILLAALNHHQHNPAPPRCLTRGPQDAYTPSPEEPVTPLHDFREMCAALNDVGKRRRAATI